MNFDISIIDSLEALEQFVPEWLAFLDTEPMGITAFNDPRYIIARWKSHNFNSDNDTQNIIVVLRESGSVCCIAPFCRRRQFPFPIEFGFKKICSVKICQLECYGDSFIFHDKGNENNVMFDHVFRTLRQHYSRFDIWYLMDIRTNSPFWYYCNRKQIADGIRVRKTFQMTQTVYRIRLPESMEALLATLNKKRRKNIRYNLKHYYEEEAADNRFVKITQPEQVDYLLQAVEHVSAHAWQSIARGTANTASSGSARNRLFFQELARQGMLRSYVLERNGSPIAFRNGAQSGKYFCGMGNQYDRVNHEKLFPGIVCTHNFFEDLFQENTPQVVDLGLGDYGGYKSVWANDNVESMTLYLTGSFKGAAIVQTQTAINTVVRWGKRILDQLGIKEWILNVFKGKIRFTMRR